MSRHRVAEFPLNKNRLPDRQLHRGRHQPASLGEVFVQQKAIDPRVDRMFGKDRLWAVVALVAVWLLYTFVFYILMPHLKDETVMAVLLISGGLVMLFNAAAIYAMVKHYSEDRTHIYGLDLHYLDIMKQRKG
jgi:hypothetical protein